MTLALQHSSLFPCSQCMPVTTFASISASWLELCCLFHSEELGGNIGIMPWSLKACRLVISVYAWLHYRLTERSDEWTPKLLQFHANQTTLFQGKTFTWSVQLHALLHQHIFKLPQIDLQRYMRLQAYTATHCHGGRHLQEGLARFDHHHYNRYDDCAGTGCCSVSFRDIPWRQFDIQRWLKQTAIDIMSFFSSYCVGLHFHTEERKSLKSQQSFGGSKSVLVPLLSHKQ